MWSSSPSRGRSVTAWNMASGAGLMMRVCGMAGCELVETAVVKPETTECELCAMLLGTVARVDELRPTEAVGATSKYSDGNDIHTLEVW